MPSPSPANLLKNYSIGVIDRDPEAIFVRTPSGYSGDRYIPFTVNKTRQVFDREGDGFESGPAQY
jgi:hypothetical protein